MVKRFKVQGHSMEPAIKSGTIVLVNLKSYRTRNPQPGDIVVFMSPEEDRQAMLCKRIVSFDPSTRSYKLRGDNEKDSLDSRKFGPVKKAQILGRVIGY